MARTKKPVPSTESPVLGTLIAAPPVSTDHDIMPGVPLSMPVRVEYVDANGNPTAPDFGGPPPVSDLAGLAARSVAEGPIPSEVRAWAEPIDDDDAIELYANASVDSLSTAELRKYVSMLEGVVASLNGKVDKHCDDLRRAQLRILELEEGTIAEQRERIAELEEARTFRLMTPRLPKGTVPVFFMSHSTTEVGRRLPYAEGDVEKHVAYLEQMFEELHDEKNGWRMDCAMAERILRDAFGLPSREGFDPCVIDAARAAAEKSKRTPSDDFATYQRVATGRLKFGQWRGNTLVDPVNGAIVGQVAPEVPAPGAAAKAWTCSVVLGDQQAAGPKGTEADARAWVERMSGRGIV